MEKQSTGSRQQWCPRLLKRFKFYLITFIRNLIFLCMIFCIFPLFAQDSEKSIDLLQIMGIELSDLQFIEIETDSYALTRTFIIELSQITPSRIQTEVPSLGDGVSILEFNKTVATVNGSPGTRFTLVLEFDHPGEWDLPKIPFTLDKIQTDKTWFTFPQITIEINPAMVTPLAFFYAPQSVMIGEKVSVQLMVQNCGEVIAIKNNLNTDSLFSLVQTKQTLPYIVNNSLGNPIAIAEYSFVGLEEGSLSVPSVQVAIVSLTGEHRNIISEPLKIKVLASAETSIKDSELNFYEEDDGLANVEESSKATVIEPDKKIELVQNIVDKEVIRLHIVQGFRNGLAVCALLCILISIVLFCLRKKQKIRFLLLAIICFIGVCLLSITVSKRRAVCYQTKLQTIPELDASSRGLIDSGTIVRVKRKSGNWYLVQLSDNRRGWIPCKECIDVK
ncbi:MAG: hypothetical protein BKP49_03150 [Treponema sp. CETP13]|nr:MAG: hypothetical protein BKP49_03150 [Treponema sp. CETP13]